MGDENVLQLSSGDGSILVNILTTTNDESYGMRRISWFLKRQNELLNRIISIFVNTGIDIGKEALHLSITCCVPFKYFTFFIIIFRSHRNPEK